MANQTFSDILPDKRNQYARLKSKKAKSRFLTHLQEVYGFERKYLIKLLTGERTYHPHPGRGCTYGPEFARYALKLHEACKYLCAPYFRVRLPTLIKDWEAINLHSAVGRRESPFKPIKPRLCFGFSVSPNG